MPDPDSAPGRRRVAGAEDPWDWVDNRPEPPAVDVSAITVTAVLVSHNGAAWLPAALESLRELTVAPTRFVAVDTGSRDASLDLLRDCGLFEIGIDATAAEGFGAAVARAVAAAPPTEWLWLLHDDITVEPDALEKLLARTVLSPEADVLGPKLLEPGRRTDGPRRISELGQTITDSGRRELRLEPGEIDQQQHVVDQVLGVSSCGMLVRRAVWDALGGLAPEVPVFRDGLEFGWRATAAGHTVLTCPEAAIVHRQAGRHQLREAALIGPSAYATDRLLGMRVVAARRGGMPRLVAGGVVRALGHLLAKSPALAATELRTVRGLLDPAPIRSLRARATGPVDDAAAAAVRRLRPGRWSEMQHGADRLGRAIGTRWRNAFGNDPATSIDELTGDDFAEAGPGRYRGVWSNPLAVTLIVLTLTALFAGRELIAPGRLRADLLLPSQPGLGEAYAAYLDPIAGAPGQSAAPWIGWTALGSTLTLGSPELFVSLVLLAGVPLPVVTAYLLLGRLVASPRLRILAAVGHGLVPVLLGVVNRGLLGTAVVAIFLPLLGIAVHGLLTRRGRGPEGWPSAWSAGLLLTLIGAYAPPLLVLALVAAGIGMLGARRDRGRMLRIGVAAGVPLILLAPWWPAVARGWSRLLVGPDAGLGDQAAGPAWALLLGRTPGPGLPPEWLAYACFGALWALALLAAGIAVRPGRSWGLWLAALAGFAAAIVISRQLATTLPQGTKVRPEVTALLVLAFGALILAAATGLDGLARESGGRPGSRDAAGAEREPASRIRRLGTGAVTVLTLAALAGGLGWWLIAGAAGPLHRDRLQALPPYVRAMMTGPTATRTLMIRFDGPELSWSLVAGSGDRLGDADRGLAFAGSGTMAEDTRSLVSRLTSGAGDAQVTADLSRLAVGHVWVVGADAERVSRINNTPGLGAASADTPAGGEPQVIWPVPETTGRVVITGGDRPPVAVGHAPVELAEAAGPRTLRVSGPTDPRLRVTADGAEVPLRTGRDHTLADLPATATRVEVRLADPLRSWLAAGQLLGVLVVGVLAAPSPAGGRRDTDVTQAGAGRGARRAAP